MAPIPLDGIPLRHIPIVRTATKKDLTDQIRAGRYREVPPNVRNPYSTDITEAYSTFGGRCWILAQTAFLADHQGNSLRNVRHVFTTDPHQPWWSLPVRPGERAYEFDHHAGAPAPGSGRPYPHPVLPPQIAAIEAERCGPYRDAFGLCTGCGLRGRVQRRCTADDPDRSRESQYAPYAQPWKWVPCPHACGYVDQPEVRPSVLYGLIPQLSITGEEVDGLGLHSGTPLWSRRRARPRAGRRCAPCAGASRAWRPVLNLRQRELIAGRCRGRCSARKRRVELDTSTPDG